MTNIRWRIVLLLFIAGFINYLDRSALSVAAPAVMQELHMSPGSLGLLFSTFFIGYAAFNFIGGWAADRWGGKRVFSGAILTWSLFCGATGLATGFGSLLAIRTLFGMAEGPLATTINKIVNNWFPHKESATAFGFANCGLPLGGAVAGPVVGLLTAAYGWRVAFAGIACFGLLWLVFWQFMATDKPHQHPRISDEERQLIESDRSVPEDPSEVRSLGFYLKQPAILAAMISYFGYSYILFFFLTWFPSFLTMDRHLSLKSMSLATVLPWVLGFVGYGLSGVLSDLIFRRTGNALRARKWVLIVCLGTAGVCVALAGAVTTTVSALVLMAIAVFALYLSGSTYWALIQDTIPGPKLGRVGGCVHAIANCAGIVGPTATGFLVQQSHTFFSAFVLAGGIALASVLAVTILLRPRSSTRVEASSARVCG
ncbi:sugar phosphate permease [Paraburkholderia sp. BL6665CI2N2]|uniref:MFS transporter n=1 Tax=unclassified Paraburkholderia TaxID=2615204 RepID=UPI000D06DE9E|nr:MULTISPECIES: MFS transporter [unclassified Paraburkholderia]PRY09186.1 sugar phosphate permease [Paraburkholderia sp. BL25I1N1]TDY20914.1 sugar phosphate permease [Paraburkholderia sp. BL6665CI2N2]